MTPERLQTIRNAWGIDEEGNPYRLPVESILHGQLHVMELVAEIERLSKVQETLLTDGNALAKRVEAFRAGLKQLLVNDLAVCELDYTLEPDEVEP